MRKLLALAFVLAAGCFDVEEPPCSYACSDDGKCPDNYACLADGYCHLRGEQTMCGYPDAAMNPDMGAPVGDMLPGG